MEMIPLTSIKYVKEAMRLEKKVSYIAFNSKNKTEILGNVLKYTSNFFVLLISNIEKYKDKEIYFCDRDNIKVVLEDITKNKVSHLIEDADGRYDNLIVLIDLLETEKTKYDYLQNWGMKECQITYNLLQEIGKNFTFYNYIIEKGYIILEYVENDCKSDVFSESYSENKECLFINYKGGIGDYVMVVSLLYDFISKSGFPAEKTYLIMQEGISQFDLAKCFFPDIHILKMPSYVMISQLMELSKRSNYDLKRLYTFKDNTFVDLTELSGTGHIYDINRRRMFPDADIYPFTHIEMMRKRIIEKIPSARKKQLDGMFDENKKYIGYQFFTGDLIHDKKYIGRVERCWNEENAYGFYKICIENDVNIVILSPNCYRVMPSTIEFGKLTIFEYIYIISRFTMVVGIDSSAGHIASFWNIPTLTIWGEQTPLVCEGNEIGFRVLRNNYSIVPKDGDINSVSPKIVYDTMNKMLTGEIMTERDRVITYFDSLNGYNTLFV